MDDRIESRRIALELATHALRGSSAADMVAAAEAFHRFLTGGNAKYSLSAECAGRSIESRLGAVKAQVASDAVPPPLPSEAFGRISNHDLAKSDQTPPPILTTEDGVVAVLGTDTDHIPTRLVRTPSDAA